MKKALVTFLVVLALLDGVALYYLHKNQQEKFSLMQEDVAREIEDRWQIAQNVQKQVETKKDARNFIERIDSQKEIVQDYSHGLDGLKTTLDELDRSLQERISALVVSLKQLDDSSKQSESKFATQLDLNRQESLAFNKENLDALKALREVSSQVKAQVINLGSAFDRKIEALENKLITLREDFAAIKETALTQEKVQP
jgi:soluble cytochrome b562